MKGKTKRSPYPRLGAFLYSHTLREWETAVKEGKSGRAAELTREHQQRFLGFIPHLIVRRYEEEEEAA